MDNAASVALADLQSELRTFIVNLHFVVWASSASHPSLKHSGTPRNGSSDAEVKCRSQ